MSMHDDNDEDDRDDDDEEDDELQREMDKYLEEMPEALPADGYFLTGMECLNEQCIRSATFVRTKSDGNSLDVVYAITEQTLDILTAPMKNYATHEAYLTLMDDDGERKITLIMSDLELVHVELDADSDSADDLCVTLSYLFKEVQTKLLTQKEEEK